MRLYAEPEYRKRLGMAAQARAELFDEETVHEQMKKIYFGEGER